MKKPKDKMLNGEKLIDFPPRSETRQGGSLSLLLCNIVIEFLATAIRKREASILVELTCHHMQLR